MTNKSSTSGNENTPKSKNKTCKKKRAIIKMKTVQEQNTKHTLNEEIVWLNACKKFIMVEQPAIGVVPLKTKFNTPTPASLTYQTKLQTSRQPRDEYEVENSEDETDEDNKPINDMMKMMKLVNC